jgi:hypothetical protein
MDFRKEEAQISTEESKATGGQPEHTTEILAKSLKDKIAKFTREEKKFKKQQKLFGGDLDFKHLSKNFQTKYGKQLANVDMMF